MYSDKDLYELDPSERQALGLFERAAKLADEEDISFEQALQRVRDMRGITNKKGK
jgi:hypothetical protein